MNPTLRVKIFIVWVMIGLLVTSCIPIEMDLQEITPTVQPTPTNTLSNPFSSFEEEKNLDANPVQIVENADFSEHVIWVNNSLGADTNSGLSPEKPVYSIQKALDMSYPGVFIRIAPGIYRESLTVTVNGTPNEPITILSDEGPGSVIIRGSESSKTLSWKRMSENTIGLPENVNITKSKQGLALY